MKRSSLAGTEESRKKAPTTPTADAAAAPLSKTILYQPLFGHAFSNKLSAKRELELPGFLHELSARHQRAILSRNEKFVYSETTGAAAGRNTNSADGYLNTGGRPVSQDDFVGKLQGRALTLVGGGFTKSSVERLIQPKTAMSNRWNPRPRKRQRRGTSSPSSSSKVATTTVGKIIILDPKTRAEANQRQVVFLNRMNQLWNEYAVDLLLKDGGGGGGETKETVVSVNRGLANRMEWVGARIRIESCDSYPDLVGRMGYVVAITQNTWCIVVVVIPPTTTTKQERKNCSEISALAQSDGESGTARDNGDEDAPSLSPHLRQYYIPKQKSTLSVLFPLNSASSELPTTSAPDKPISLLLKLDCT